YANLKAFLVNRVGDFGFLLGIAVIYMYFQTLDYSAVFAIAPQVAHLHVEWLPGVEWNLLTVVCILLFIGAMGKSAQVPLHVWLPDSMEGPTPISALIHAATMVTAGVFMVARMSPLYELSTTALSVVLFIGTLTAFFLGLVAMVQNDIKRVVAYSTISQLGYMMVANAVSAYAAGIFHLTTHAFFKALLFLGAGSVIIALHHEQDMRAMGGLRKYMPVTYWTTLVGALALCGVPPFAGFFSKDSIIEAVHHSQIPGSDFAYVGVMMGVFVTAFYTFRMIFMTFHGKPRMDEHALHHVRESPFVVTFPLVMLAIPSLLAGAVLMEPMLFGNLFGESLVVVPTHAVLVEMGRNYHGLGPFITHGLESLPFVLAVLGIIGAWLLYVRHPYLPDVISQRARFLHTLLVRKYFFDEVNEVVFAAGARRVGDWFWKIGDLRLIDGLAVNGTARVVGWVSSVVRYIQTGYVYHYAFAMILGLFLLLTFFLHR
ncbi:MAG: NADH-quinone oxidoreductase subunit L, partial [Acidiferrobacterales bacterium]|nr:NADH-quinone oxidoreductase subunit L [Acidiferrobacterales bacterium]